jgi:hypothetical protein
VRTIMARRGSSRHAGLQKSQVLQDRELIPNVPANPLFLNLQKLPAKVPHFARTFAKLFEQVVLWLPLSLGATAEIAERPSVFEKIPSIDSLSASAENRTESSCSAALPSKIVPLLRVLCR